MRTKIKSMFALAIMSAAVFTTSCSDKGNEGTTVIPNGGVINTISDNSIGGNAFQIGDYTLYLGNDNTFEAVNETNNQLFNGRYTYKDKLLSLNQITTRAFTIEVGKTYSFIVEKNAAGGYDFTDQATGEKTTAMLVKVQTPSVTPTVDTKLSAQKEKEYIRSVAEELEKYAVADEWKEFTDVVKELRNVDGDAIEDYIEDLFVKTVASEPTSYKQTTYNYETGNPVYDDYGHYIGWNTTYRIDTYTYNYEYYNKVLMASQAKGEFTAKYNGSWQRTSNTGDLKMTYSDKKGAKWVLTVKKSGSIGKILIEDADEFYAYPGYIPDLGPYDKVIQGNDYSFTEEITSKYIDLPKQVTATLTRNGVERVKTTVNINQFSNRNTKTYALSLIGKSSGTAEVYIKPSGTALEVKSTFNYADGSSSSATATVKKGGTTLLSVEASCTPKADGDESLYSVANAKVTATVLGKLSVRLSTGEAKEIADAIDDARGYNSRLDVNAVTNAKEKINSGLVAYITNSNAAIRQADFVADVKSREEVYADWSDSYYGDQYYGPEYKTRKVYELVPAIKFSDGSSYSFSNYFTESFFKGVIDYAKQLGKDFENMVED